MNNDAVTHLVADPDEQEAPPTFYELLQLAQDHGLVGEEDTLLTVTVTMVRGGLVVLYGISRGGKDFVIECALSLFPPNTAYEWSSGSDSDTANYYDAETLNGYDVHYLGDLARMDEETEKVAKPWGEGKDATRKYTDKNRPEGDQVVTQTLECPRTVLATVATDNRNFDMNDYPEFSKRATMLGVDGSQSQTEAILKRKALEHADKVKRNIDPVQAAKIRDYMGSIPVDAFTGHPNNRIVNPASENIIDQHPIPTNFAEARFDGEKLLGYMETITLVNHPKRFTVDTGKGLKMLTVPVDVWYAMKILGENMVMSSLNLTDEDQAVLRYLRESDSAATKRDIQQGLRQAGYAIRTKDVARSLESMREAMYVREQQNGSDPNTFVVSDFAQVTTHNVGLDYAEVAKAAAEEVYNVPGVSVEVADAYVGRFCEGDGLTAVDPYTGQSVDITEDTSLQDAVDAATEDVADIFDDDPFWGDEEGENAADVDDEPEAKTQGTLA